jgi:hypothetical protein
MDQSSASGEETSTVAVRGSSKSSARSPKYEFFVMVPWLDIIPVVGVIYIYYI